MSRRQKTAHAEKVAERTRWFPEKDIATINGELGELSRVHHVLGMILQAGIYGGHAPEDQQHMFGAHMTIALYAINRATDILNREKELAVKELKLIDVTQSIGLVDVSGKPIANA